MINKINFAQINPQIKVPKQERRNYRELSQDIFQLSGQTKVSFSGQPSADPEINSVLERFNKPNVPEKHLRKWLNQFEEQDRPTAIKLLQNIDYHTYPDMVNETKKMHRKLTQELNKDGFSLDNVDFSRIYTAKSGDVVSYIYRKANKIHTTNFKTIEALQSEKPEKLNNRALVLLDDYIGTGTQFLLEFFARNKQNRDLLNNYKKIYFVVNTANEKANEKFGLLAKGKSNRVADIICEEFKNSAEMIKEKDAVREDLSLVQGDKLKLIALNKEAPLLSPKNKKLSQEDKDQLKGFLQKYNIYKYPFGVGNTQGHTTFFYSAPNTLPDILWNSKITEKSGWVPLFKRTEDISVYQIAKYIPKDKQVW